MPDSSTWFSPAASQGPISSRSVSAKRLSGTFARPRNALRRSRIWPSAVMRKARKLVVPQSTPIMDPFPLFLFGGQQRRIAARRRRVDGYNPLLGKSIQRDRSPCLRSRARKAAPTKRLHADHRADLVAIDIGVADAQPLGNAPLRCLDPAVDAKGQAIAGGVYRIHQLVHTVGGIADDAQDGTEDLRPEFARTLQQEGARRE